MRRHRSLVRIAILAAVVSLAATVGAEVITMKNGETFKGKIILKTETEVQLETAPGAVLTFPQSQIESIEAEHTLPQPTGTAKPPQGQTTSASTKEIRDLQDMMKDLAEDVKKLKEEVAGLRKATAEVGVRTQQEATPRGDRPDQPPSNLILVNMKWTRGGDNIRVTGAIRNMGGSPGKWARITAIAKDTMGNVVGRGDTTPDVVTPGIAVHDLGWVYPGKDVIFSLFVPFGGYSPTSVFAAEKQQKNARRLPLPKDISMEWTLELPPKYKELLPPEGGGQGASQPTAGDKSAPKTK